MESYRCKHYKRKCEKMAPCCKKYYRCRLCHNEAVENGETDCQVEVMDRYAVQSIRCLACQTEQAPSDKCIKCSTVFARYYCQFCKFWDDDKKKNIFHCEKCNMCRIGKRDDYFHCDGCNVCLSLSLKDAHKCINLDTQKCPICFENLKISVQPFQNLRCGHQIHLKCLEQYFKKSQKNCCPTCNQSIEKMSEELIAAYDQEALRYGKQMQEDESLKEFADKKVNIVCNDCNKKSLDQPFSIFTQNAHTVAVIRQTKFEENNKI